MQQTQEILAIGVPAALAGLAGWMAYGTFSPGSSFWGRIVRRAPIDDSTNVSLTFDDGPTEGVTDRVLDILEELRISATFFVIGQNAVLHPRLLRQMDARGHIVANHSYNHAHMGLFRGPCYWRREVQQTDDAIAHVIGKRPTFFRPPMGITTPAIQWAGGRSHHVITWSRRAMDGVQTDADAILARLAEPTQAGDILAMHDGIDPHIRQPVDRVATLAALRPLAARLRRRKLEFVRLDDLLGVAPYADVKSPLPGAEREPI